MVQHSCRYEEETLEPLVTPEGRVYRSYNEYDTRDLESNPRKGMFHDLVVVRQRTTYRC